MTLNLDCDNIVVGKKETLQLIRTKKVQKVFIAQDVDEDIKDKLINAAKNYNIEFKLVDSKMKLGRECGIDVAASSAALLK